MCLVLAEFSVQKDEFLDQSTVLQDTVHKVSRIPQEYLAVFAQPQLVGVTLSEEAYSDGVL